MRFRIGVLIGLAIGFYLGAKAGREQYEKINNAVRQGMSSDTFDSATSSARNAMNQGLQRVKVVTGRGKSADGDDGAADEATEESSTLQTSTPRTTTETTGMGTGATDPTNGPPLA